MKAKTTFKLDELDQAIKQLYRFKLVDGWTGILNLETNGKELIITQFPSSNNWTKGFTTFYVIYDWFTWGDIQGFYERSDGKIELVSYDANAKKGEFYDRVEILTKKEAFNVLRSVNFLANAKDHAYEMLNEILSEIRAKQEELEV